jgi:hypothetical protein
MDASIHTVDRTAIIVTPILNHKRISNQSNIDNCMANASSRRRTLVGYSNNMLTYPLLFYYYFKLIRRRNAEISSAKEPKQLSFDAEPQAGLSLSSLPLLFDPIRKGQK